MQTFSLSLITRCLTATAAMLLPAAVAAQADPAPAELAPGALRVPIHAAPRAEAPARGWWAAGDTYKVSFHDGFVFVPYLGAAAADSAPLRWTTESVTVGDASLVAPAATPRHAHSDWRYEYRYGAVTEAYDVRAEGVEQTFVVHRRPAVSGDLVVAGRIDTRLRAAALPAGAHAALTFCDEQDRAVIRYGAAFAVDAGGDRLPITTVFDGGRASLTVPGTWLARARFPVTVDPLVSGVVIRNEGTTLGSTSVARDESSATDNVMVAYLRIASIVDRDMVVVVTDNNFANPVVVFSDLSTATYDAVDVAFVGGATRWAVAFQASSMPSGLGVYLHQRGNRTLNSGVTLPISLATTVNQVPRIGGASAASEALIVFQSGFPTLRTEVWGVVLNAQTQTFGVPKVISGATVAATRPDVSSGRNNGESNWLVAYEAVTHGDPSDDRDVFVTSVSSSTLGSTASFLVGTDVSTPPHKCLPVVDGRGGRYLVAMARSASLGVLQGEVVVQRVDWPESASAPTTQTPNVLTTITHRSLGVAFDNTSRSHWCVTSESVAIQSDSAWRVGFTGSPTEAVFSFGASPSVAYDSRTREFQIVYHVSGVVFGARLQYPPDAITVGYGAGCGHPAYSVSADPPFAGSEFFRILFTGPPAGTSCVLFLSLAQAAIPLDAIGMFGCVLHVDPQPGRFLLSANATADAGGARLTLPLRDAPLLQLDLFAQWLWLEPGLNALGVGASAGRRIQVR